MFPKVSSDVLLNERQYAGTVGANGATIAGIEDRPTDPITQR